MKHTLLIFILSFPLISIGQNAFISAGDSKSNQSVIITYSIGQSFFQQEKNETADISQGVNQVYEVIDTTPTLSVGNWSVDIYPNPVSDQLTIQNNLNNEGNWSYQLINEKGQILAKKSNISTQKTFIDMSSLTHAVYFIQLQSNHFQKTFKIIKNR